MFDRFSVSDNSPGSVGLGLWIVHTLVAAHGGSVRYERALHGGSRFVLLPPVPGPQHSANGHPELNPLAC